MPANPTHDCPLCHGAGKVSKKVAESKVTVRDRKSWNEKMRKINARRRLKAKKVLAT